MARENEAASEPQDYGHGDGAEELAHGVSEGLATRHGVGEAVEFLVLLMEAAAHLLLGVEGLDDAQTAESLLDVGHEYAPLRLPFERLTFEALAHATHDDADEGQQKEHEDGKLPRHCNHHAQAGDNHDGVLEQHIERRHD